ncbi:MAG: 7-cyano-7-deazaguanine synthase QueC [Gammaproteobacteria bacterium]
MKNAKAVLLFSGGQDSTTCLAWSLQRFDEVVTIGFDYGQSHAVELECRANVLAAMNPGGEDYVLKLPILNELSETALTRDMEIKMLESGLPSTFVPGRNIMFLTVAAMLAYRMGMCNLVTGVCETDFSGYPDCRDLFVKSMSTSLSAGMDTAINIHTPLMFITKAETWQLAYEIGGQDLVNLIIEETHTCYRGKRDVRHEWGYGCGTCPACELRRAGYETWMSRPGAKAHSNPAA